MASALISALSERGQTVAVAESLTGGMLCSALVEVPGASAVVRGAVVAYATELKHRLLGVDSVLLTANGPVDPDVAAQMALGVRDRLGADWGLATTGVAGPDPQDGKAPGTVYIAVAGPLTSGSAASADPDDAVGAVRAAAADPAVGGAAVRPGRPAPIGTRVLRLNLPGGRAAVRWASTERVVDLLLDVLIANGVALAAAEHDDPGDR